MFGAHYSVITRSDHLEHHGVKGMKWGKHLFGLARLKGNMTNTMETDTGTGANNKSESIDEHMKNYFAKRDARVKQQLETNAKKQEASRKAAAEAAAAEEAKKKKKSGSKGKKSGSKAKTKKEEVKEEPKTEEKIDEQKVDGSQVSLPDDLVKKLQDLHNELTPEEIKIRAEDAINKTKELLAKLPEDPTEEDIMSLLDLESNKRGVGYDRYVLNIAVDTAFIKYYDNKINELESKDPTSEELKKYKEEKANYEKWLKESLKTGWDAW